VSTTSRQQQKAATRAAILRIAAEEFDHHGYAATSVARIADRLEMTKGTVYFHFASKSDLAAEIVRLSVSAWEPPTAAADDGLTSLDAAREACRDLAARCTDDAVMRAALRLIRQESPVNDRYGETLARWAGTLRRHLDRAVGAGELRPGTDVDALAWLLVATFLGLQEVTARLEGGPSLVARVDQAWDTVLDGVAAAR
jgi:AcrR family transcriptional regulator